GESQTGNDFNGDQLFTANTVPLFRWKGVDYASLAALQAATGFELNGRSGDPLFISLATGNVLLAPASPCVDAGVRLYGINDGFNGRLPDVGAWESGLTDAVRPAPIQDLR